MIDQAVILCGGYGKRLLPITNKIPKPMVNINTKPFLQYLIEQCQFVLSFPTKSFRKEYMHELGIALVRIRSSGLVWIKNHLITQSSEEEYNLHLQIFEKFQKYIHIQQLKYEQ